MSTQEVADFQQYWLQPLLAVIWGQQIKRALIKLPDRFVEKYIVSTISGPYDNDNLKIVPLLIVILIIK